MRAHLLAWAVCSLFLVGPAEALAQWSRTGTAAGGSAPVDLESLKAQLRDELKSEIKAEIKAEMGEGGTTAAATADAWSEEDWQWEAPVKPELNFLEFDGYFRFRYDLFKNLDLGTYYTGTNALGDRVEYGPFLSGLAPPTTLCATDVGVRPTDTSVASGSCTNRLGDTDTIGGANMRLRVEPVFNVYEDTKIKMQVDILDNVVLGSTPDGFPGNPLVPLLSLSQTQLAPSDNTNALIDSVRVKRVWAEVGTPIGQLHFGRMPAHFGMGLLANEGRGIDSDYGDSHDRILFATQIGDFQLIPGFDWSVSGPTSAVRLQPQGQPFDRDQRDDVDQYLLAVVRRDSEQQIKDKLENDELVLNYGTYQTLRFQSLDAANFYYRDMNANLQAGPQTLLERDMQAWIYSFWAKLMWRKLTIEAEYVGVVGSIGSSATAGSFDARGAEISLNQHGGVINAEHKFLRDALTVSFMVVVASGDPAPGWGVYPLAGNGGPGSWESSQAGANGRINNLRLDPDFYVDLIFWRQLVGTVTDAIILRPSVQYNLTDGIGARLDVIYSRAMYAQSTPSASRGELMDANLGIEADAKIFLKTKEGFSAWLQYGLFVPFRGMNFRALDENGGPKELDAGIAQTIQAMLAVTF